MVVYVIVVLQIRTSTNMVEVNQHLQDPSLQAVLEAQGHALQAQSLNAKDKFVDVITQHVLVDSTRYLLEELKEGLAVMGVYKKSRNTHYSLQRFSAIKKLNLMPKSLMPCSGSVMLKGALMPDLDKREL